MKSARRNSQRLRLALIVLVAVLTGNALFSCASRKTAERVQLAATRTLWRAPAAPNATHPGNPFGIAVAADGTVYVTDGEKNSLSEITPDGATKVITENLNTPSAVALAPDGTLVVADTGSHTIKRVEPRGGIVKLIAGLENRAGFADGDRSSALFDGPIGVAAGGDGTIYVADTYNDRIRAIDAGGAVRTLAGSGAPGFNDSPSGAQARFHTPCGIALAPDGALIVADTGNHRLRRVAMDGAVTTLSGTTEAGTLDGLLDSALFDEPTGLAVGPDGTVYVADARSPALRAVTFKFIPQVRTLAGDGLSGFIDGALTEARFNHPSGVAVQEDGTVFVADTGNGAVRAIAADGWPRGRVMTKEESQRLRPSAAEFRSMGEPRWPYDPPTRPREIAATFGEVRGEVNEGKDAWFHNGLDIPGAYGETARLVRDERMLNPLSVEGVGGARERIRFPALGYIHLRLGRNRDDQPFNDERFRLLRDERNKVVGVRVRRGAKFLAGEALGTLNDQYHVHLIAGPVGSEFNALAALDLPGVRDTVAPIIEPDGVQLWSRNGEQFEIAASGGSGKAGGVNSSPANVHGDVRIVVRAYDQMDGNAARRKLGLYRLGYQILNADGNPAPGFSQPLETISFESLPDDSLTASLAYAKGSQSGYTGQTIFAYIVTNHVRDREAAEDYWHTDRLSPGAYIVRVFAADFFGNRTTRDVPVRVVP